MSWNNLKKRTLYPLVQRLLALVQSILGELQPEELDGLDRQVESDNVPKSRHSRSNSREEKDREQQRVDGPPAHWVERVRKAAPELLHQNASAYMSMARSPTRPSGSKTEGTREFDNSSHSNTESIHEVSTSSGKQVAQGDRHHSANIQDVVRNKAGPSGEETPESSIESYENVKLVYEMPASTGDEDASGASGHVNNIVAKQPLRTTSDAVPEQEEPIPSMTDSEKAPQPDAFFPALNIPNTQTSLPTSDLSQLSDYDIPTRYSTTFGISPLQNSAEDSQVPVEGVWPELPEAPSSGTSDEVAMALSELERLRRLDREQRGILWSE